MLLALVNDMLDLKLIEDGLFTPKIQVFKPSETIKFIKKLVRLKGLSSQVENTRIEVNHITPEEELVGD